MLAFYLGLLETEEDRQLFEKIYYSHRKQMLTLAVSIIENEDDSEDLVHDVFCTVAEKHLNMLQSIKNEQDMKNYLLKATKNRALNMKRDKKQYISLNESEAVLISKEDLNDNGFLDFICDKMTYSELVEAIRSLDKKYEEVLYLHFVLELPIAEVADLLSRNIHTVKKQLVRGKKMLIEKIGVNEGVKKINDKVRSEESL